MDGARMPGMATPEEVDALSTVPSEEADERFLQLMIPHHQAALQMTEAVLEKTDRTEVEQLATAIYASQEAEIEVMRKMLQDMGASPPEEEPQMDMSGMDMGAEE